MRTTRLKPGDEPEVTVTCEGGRFQAKAQQPGRNGAFAVSSPQDSVTAALFSLAAQLFGYWMEAEAKREKLEDAQRNDDEERDERE